MIKKIICLLLCITTILSLIIIPSIAAEAEPYYSDDEISEFVAQGENIGFGEIIDVEEYATKAMSEGYDSLSILRIGVPDIMLVEDNIQGSSPVYGYTIPVYLYNPELLIFMYADETNEHNLNLVYRPSVEEDFESGVIVPLNRSEGEFQIGDMFIEGLLCGSFSLEEGADFISADEVEFHFEKLIYNAIKRDGSMLFNQELQINKAIEFTGIDHRIAYTGAWKDMGIFFDKTEEELREEYPYDTYTSNKFQVIHLYEKGYDTSDYELYLYLYNPSTREFKETSIDVYLNLGQGQNYYRCVAEILDVDFTLVKCRVNLHGQLSLPEGLAVRDYYISKIDVPPTFFGTTNYPKATYEVLAHYEFSNENLSSWSKNMYSYDFRTVIKDILGNGSLKLELPDYAQIEILDTNVELTEQVHGTYSFSLSEKTDISLSYRLSVDYPLLDSSIDYVVKPSDFVQHFAPVYGKSTYKNFRQIPRAKTSVFSDELVDNSEDSINVRSNSNEVLQIKATPTYYNLGSSAKGADYYQTLLSLGFSLSMDLLEMNDVDPYNDRSISYIDYVYDLYYAYTLVSDFSYMSAIPGLNIDDSYISVGSIKPWEDDSGFYFSATNIYNEDLVLGKLLSEASLYGSIILGQLYNGLVADEFDSEEDFYKILSVDRDIVSDFFFFYEEDIEKGELIADDEQFLDAFNRYYDANYGEGLLSELKLSMPEASEEEVLAVYNWLLDFINHYRYKENRLTFADTFELMGYDQADFWTVADDFNFLWAICHAWFGMDEEYESFEDIKAFEIITPDQLESIRDMGLSDLSATYFIDELEASEMKAEIIAALEKGEAYVLMRFDVYDVESKEAMFVYKAPDGELHTSVEGGYSAFINKQRVYKDFQILEIGLANNKDVVVKTVSMEPIDFTGPIIAPNPPTTDNIDTPLDELGDLVGGLFGNNEDGLSFLSIVAIIGGVALALGVVLLVIKLKGSKTVVNIPSSFVESPPAPNPQVKAKKSSHRQYKKTKPKKRE